MPHALVEMRMLGKSDGGSAFSSTSRDRQSEARRDPLIELLTFFFVLLIPALVVLSSVEASL